MVMPNALVFTLRPDVAATTSPALTRAAHAAGLELIRLADADLAARLHADDRVKPPTVAPLGGFDTRGAARAVSPARAYDIRVTMLAAELEGLAERWTPVTVPQLRFDGI